MVTQVEGAKRLIEAAARKYDQGERCDLEAAMAKLAGSEAGVFCAQEAMRIFGGYSYSVEYDIERYYRDAMLMCIGEGTNEILRTVIAKQLIERYRHLNAEDPQHGFTRPCAAGTPVRRARAGHGTLIFGQFASIARSSGAYSTSTVGASTAS
jgi:hypothetical protein